MNTIINNYNNQVSPYQDNKKWKMTRADKETRYNHFTLKNENFNIKERWGIELIKVILERTENPVVSCSFGIDSIVTLYLTRKALVELNRDPSDVNVVWNNTLNEFKEVRDYAKMLTQLWNLKLVTTKPKKVLKQVIDEHGGVDKSYFMRKGDRSIIGGSRPLSEKCCSVLKHEPMNRAMKENQWDGIINGLRADESNQRKLASLRDGEFFYSSGTWKAYVCRPILWMNEKDIWDYVRQEGIPYNKLYDQNMIRKYPEQIDEYLLWEIGLVKEDIEENKTVNRWQAIVLNKNGYDVFTPRTGCQMCPIPVKYGYLHWMRNYYPKVYDAMVYKLEYGKALLKLVPRSTINEIKMITGIDITEDNAHEYMEEILESKPCIFDEF